MLHDSRPRREPGATDAEREARAKRLALFRTSPISDRELLDNLLLYVRPQVISRLLALHHAYERIVQVPGCVMDFGTRWGTTMGLFMAFRQAHEPHAFLRSIIGFDTFRGFPTPSPQDGQGPRIREGEFGVPDDYFNHLAEVLSTLELEAPHSHIRKWEVLQGLAQENLHLYLDQHPETTVALAYFDMDLYQPTVECLRLVLPRVPPGGVLLFDEYAHPSYPGETLAAMEALAGRTYSIQQLPFAPGLAIVTL